MSPTKLTKQQAHKALTNFDKAVQVKQAEAQRCNAEAHLRNVERLKTNTPALADSWMVIVWQRPGNPKDYTVTVHTNIPDNTWAVSVETARTNLETALTMALETTT